MWNDAQAKALQMLFEAFDKNSIQWMVFRNYEGLPEQNSSKDVDLLLNRRQINRVCRILEETMVKAGYTNKTFDRFQCIWCYSFFKNIPGRWESIKIDIFYGQVWRGVSTIPFYRIYNTAEVYHGFRVPNPATDAFLLWVKNVMTGGKIKEKYIPIIQKYGNTAEFRKLTIEAFNKEFADRVADSFATYDTVKQTGSLQKEMRFISWSNGFKRDPINSCCSLVMHCLLELIRRFKPSKQSIIYVYVQAGVDKGDLLGTLTQKAQDAFLKDPDKVENIDTNSMKLFSLKRKCTNGSIFILEGGTNAERMTMVKKVIHPCILVSVTELIDKNETSEITHVDSHMSIEKITDIIISEWIKKWNIYADRYEFYILLFMKMLL